jgi:hypothetical protein
MRLTGAISLAADPGAQALGRSAAGAPPADEEGARAGPEPPGQGVPASNSAMVTVV